MAAAGDSALSEGPPTILGRGRRAQRPRSFLMAHPAVFRSRPASGSLLFARAKRSNQEKARSSRASLGGPVQERCERMNIPRKTRSFRAGRFFASLANERSASGANDVSACGGRVVHGAFIPSRKTRAGPPGEALLSRCFLVTSLHQQRSDPLSEGQRKLCSGQQRSDPLGRRPSGSFASGDKSRKQQPSGSSALVAGAGNRLLRFDAYQAAR